MIQATSSPIVVYEYVYALPAIGIIDAKLGVAQSGERAAEACDDECQRDRGARAFRDRSGGAHEETAADDGADAQADQRPRTERAFESALRIRATVRHQAIDRLRRVNELATHPPVVVVSQNCPVFLMRVVHRQGANVARGAG